MTTTISHTTTSLAVALVPFFFIACNSGGSNSNTAANHDTCRTYCQTLNSCGSLDDDSAMPVQDCVDQCLTNLSQIHDQTPDCITAEQHVLDCISDLTCSQLEDWKNDDANYNGSHCHDSLDLFRTCVTEHMDDDVDNIDPDDNDTPFTSALCQNYCQKVFSCEIDEYSSFNDISDCHSNCDSMLNSTANTDPECFTGQQGYMTCLTAIPCAELLKWYNGTYNSSTLCYDQLTAFADCTGK